MNNLERYQNISVLGAAGKMGSGILLLNVLHSVRLMHQPQHAGKTFVIHAIDQNYERLEGLMKYLKTQVLKWAEKNIVELRKQFIRRSHLIDNKDIIEAFVNDAISIVKPSVTIESAYQSYLIFEAIIEDETAKTDVLRKIKVNNPNHPFFLSNTSAIPISVLDDKAGLDKHIIGCHFYNPPAVQKVIEVVELNDGLPELSQLVHGFATQMNKLIVEANDIAGFIGNGFFMREIIYAVDLYESLRKELSPAEALLAVDKVSHELLVRPMGIFQLMGYVGIDVCSLIMRVMDTYLDEPLQCPFLDDILNKGFRGGQNADGTQKDGYFKYNRGKAVEVLDIETQQYVSIDAIEPVVNNFLAVSTKVYSWNQLNRSKYKEKHLNEYFESIRREESRGALLAKDYMLSMKEIGQKLYDDGVTNSVDNVNSVMMNGFYYLYGPVNNFIK
ncbi:3-hydroxyacyl-CoA dehydrogenase family protein [Carboxylicivirga sp. RSCT41]|uniref:3-hydroxyacyl-CoA dehydrogenase family protein n=1 Tax=Carboxylicivirga agarovorans TaxID=3417570 RepID=UPI003D33A066